MSTGTDESNILCNKCGVHLSQGKVTLEYLGNVFSVDLYKCPQCGLVFIPEGLATGRMQEVEQMLEDK